MTRGFAPLSSVSESLRRPASVIAAVAVSAAYAVALIAFAVATAVGFEQSTELARATQRGPFALAAVTVLCIGGALIGLGALATWLRKTDMLLLFALWLVAVGAAVLPTQPTGHGSPLTVLVRVAVIAAATVPVVLLLRRSARGWLPPIPLHDAVLVIVFGPFLGVALVSTRQRQDARMGLA